MLDNDLDCIPHLKGLALFVNCSFLHCQCRLIILSVATSRVSIMFVSMEFSLTFLLLWGQTVSSGPILRNVSDPITDLSRGLIPMRMRCVPSDTYSIPLEKNGAFFNIIEAFRVLAKEDFEGSTPLTRFRTHSYPQPLIALTSPLEDGIKRKYVIWGLLQAWAWLSHPGHAVVTHFDLLWDDQPVGGILFGSLHLDAQYTGNASSTAVKDLAEFYGFEAPVESFSNPRQFSDTQLVVSFNYFSTEAMTKEDVQLSLLYVLAQTAQYPVHTPIIDDWKPRIQEHNCLFLAQKVVSASPFAFNLFWLIESTTIMANYIIRSGEYRNLNGLILLDGHVIGNLMLFSRISLNTTSAFDRVGS